MMRELPPAHGKPSANKHIDGETMKRIHILFALSLFALSLLSGTALAQRIEMDEGHVAFTYPDSYLVLSPQLCGVYAPLILEAGLDPEALAMEMENLNILSRGYSEDFSQNLGVLISGDDFSAEVFDIAQITDSQRQTLRRRAQNDSLWETTGMRAQDVEWQREGGVYWLFIHYTRTRADELIGRGLRYITIRNGMYVALDWQISSGRFSNRDLSNFRARLADVEILETVERAMRTVALTAEIPAETTQDTVTIRGVTSPGAALVAQAPDGNGEMQTLSVGEAGQSGSFSLLVELETEGTYPITLTASAEGMLPASHSGTIVYSAKTLPISGIAERATVTTDRTTISGTTLAGVQIQLVTPFGLSKKRSGNDGSFSFELTTEEAGDYEYTLILDRSGYNQRRMSFTITREVTDDQERARIKAGAQKISYRNLQRDLDGNQGIVMVLYGPVTQVSEAGGIYYVRMQFNRDGSGTWYNPVVIVSQGDLGVKEGDMLTAAVTVAGVYEEQDETGTDVIVPRFELMFVDKIE